MANQNSKTFSLKDIREYKATNILVPTTRGVQSNISINYAQPQTGWVTHFAIIGSFYCIWLNTEYVELTRALY